MTQKWYATLRHPKIHPHIKFGIPTSKIIGDMHRTRSGTDGRTFYYYKNQVRGQGHSDPKMVCDTPPSQDASTHQIWNSYLKEYMRYAPDTKRDGRTVRLLYASQCKILRVRFQIGQTIHRPLSARCCCNSWLTLQFP